MRLDEFIIQKYGIYSERALSLADKPGFVIIYGPNEAGKSTCLSAVSDFLFGIPNNSPHGQMFGYDQMRLKAEITLSGGGHLALTRRKGRGAAKTLTDANGKNIEEAALQRILGAMTRERFSALFGLNQVFLRQGGESLLKADGDVGRLIIEAGGGLRALVGQIRDLEEEADALFAPRKSERSFYKARAAFEDADKKIKDKLLTRDTYEEMSRKAAAAEQEYERLKTGRKTLSEQLQREQRIARVVPSLCDLDEINDKIASYADLPELRHDFADAAQAVLAERDAAGGALKETERRRAALEAKIDALAIPSALIDAESAVRDIVAKAVQVTNERASRPNRIAELARQQTQLAALRASIGIAADADIAPLLPDPAALEAVQALAGKGLQLSSQIAGLRGQIEDDQNALKSLNDSQSSKVGGGFDKPFGINVNALDSLPRLAGNLQAAADRLRRIEDDIGRRVEAIGFASINELRAFRCPDAAIIQTEIERRKEFEAGLTKHIEALSTQTRLRESARSDIARLKQAGEVPSDTAIAAVRADRDLSWTPIREAYVAKDAAIIMTVPVERRGEAARRFENLMNSADTLADRKSFEAQRIAQLAAAEKQHQDAGIGVEAAETAMRQIQKKLEEFRSGFAEKWPEAIARADDLAELKMVATERQAILEQTDKAEELRDKLHQTKIEYSPLMDLLALAEDRLRADSAANATLQARIQAVTETVKAHDSAHASYAADAAKIEQLEGQLRRKCGNLAAYEKAHTQWLIEWRSAMREIRLAENAPLERANEVVRQWSNASGILEAIRSTTKRLSQFDEDERALNALIAKCSSSFDFKLPDDPIVAADMLNKRLQRALQFLAQKEGLVPELALLTTDRSMKQQQLEVKQQVLANLCSAAGTDETSITDIAIRHKELMKLKARREQTVDTIHKAGDRHPIEVLREEWNGRELDLIRAGLEEIQNDGRRIDEEMEYARGELQNCRQALERFEADAGVNVLMAERERAAAEMHRVIDRYMEVTLARALLEGAVDRLRGEQQDPLIASAGDLFALCTRGAFSGIATDINDKGIPIVVGKRTAGGIVGVEQMSDGTRDQLYLAFRLASIEQYCATAEPLPFIGDDLLVHFDDERSRATLDLLAELGKATQVLLFTHHRSVRDMAAMLPGDAAAVIELT